MKKVLIAAALTGLLVVTGCHSSRDDQESRILSMESRLFATGTGFSRAGADSLIQAYSEFASSWPDDTLAPVYLFKAASMYMNLLDAQNSLTLFNRIMTSYPDFEKAPMCLFFTGYIQENLQQDIEKARKSYQLFIDTWPAHDFADDAQASIDNLGKTPEQMIMEFEARQKANSGEIK